MQIRRHSNHIMANDSADSESILNQLILLTEQYKRVNELLENKRNLLKQRAIILRKRQLKHRCDVQRMWLKLFDSSIPVLIDNNSIVKGESN